MAGMSVIGLCDEMEKPVSVPELTFGTDYTNLERMMLDAIISECGRCITSEGKDCMSGPRETSCPFIDIRQACGIHNLEDWQC